MPDNSGLQDPDLTDYCPVCKQDKPLDDFLRVDLDLSFGSPAPPCKECHEKGERAFEPPLMRKLSMRQRKVLRALMMDKSFAEAAKSAGCSEQYVRQLVNGHGVGRGGDNFRAMFNAMLESEGLDYHSIVRMSKLLLYSKRPHWNKTSGNWDFFPDNQTRLGMVRHLTKLRNIDPPNHMGKTAVVPVVNIITNVGKGAEPKDAPNTFTIEDGKVVNAPMVEEEAGGGG